MFTLPPWNKKLLKLEFKISISTFFSKYRFLPLFIQREAICCVYLFLTFEDFLRSVKCAGKMRKIFETKRALIIARTALDGAHYENSV